MLPSPDTIGPHLTTLFPADVRIDYAQNYVDLLRQDLLPMEEIKLGNDLDLSDFNTIEATYARVVRTTQLQKTEMMFLRTVRDKKYDRLRQQLIGRHSEAVVFALSLRLYAMDERFLLKPAPIEWDRLGRYACDAVLSDKLHPDSEWWIQLKTRRRDSDLHRYDSRFIHVIGLNNDILPPGSVESIDAALLDDSMGCMNGDTAAVIGAAMHNLNTVFEGITNDVNHGTAGRT